MVFTKYLKSNKKMKDLIEAYNSIYQLDEIRFTATGTPTARLTTPQIEPVVPSEQPKPTPTSVPKPTATTTPAPAAKPAVTPTKTPATLKTKAGTVYQARTPTSAELKAAQDARKSALAAGASRADAEEAAVKAGVAAGKPQTTTTTSTTSQAPLTPAAQDAIDKLDKAQTNSDIGNQFLKQLERQRGGRTMQQNSYDYGQMDQEQLTSLISAYNDMYKVEEEVEEIQEEDPCWKGYTQVGMKKKGGREVPNCVPSKGVPDAKGYNKEEAELEEGIGSALVKLGGAALGVWGASKAAEGMKKKADSAINRARRTSPIGGDRYANQLKQLNQSYEPEGEVVEAYDIVLDHLMSEGFASDVESAEKIMTVMSDDWLQNVIENYRGREFEHGSSARSREFEHGSTRSSNTPSENLSRSTKHGKGSKGPEREHGTTRSSNTPSGNLVSQTGYNVPKAKTW